MSRIKGNFMIQHTMETELPASASGDCYEGMSGAEQSQKEVRTMLESESPAAEKEVADDEEGAGARTLESVGKGEEFLLTGEVDICASWGWGDKLEYKVTLLQVAYIRKMRVPGTLVW